MRRGWADCVAPGTARKPLHTFPLGAYSAAMPCRAGKKGVYTYRMGRVLPYIPATLRH